MKILLSSATKLEIAPLLVQLGQPENTGPGTLSYQFRDHTIDVLITGLGMVSTTFYLSRELREKQYDLVLNLGISGCYHQDVQLGDVVLVTEETFADFGAGSISDFQSVFDLGLLDKNSLPFIQGKLVNPYNPHEPSLQLLKKVKGATINCVSGSPAEAAFITEKFNTDIETMEGAAFFYCCLQEKVRFMEIRAISNYAGERNHQKWEVDLAITNLTNVAINFLKYEVKTGIFNLPE